MEKKSDWSTVTKEQWAACAVMLFSYLAVCLLFGFFCNVVKIELISWLIFIATVALANIIFLPIKNSNAFDDEKEWIENDKE